MLKRLLLLSLVIAFAVVAADAQSIVVKVREADGSPSIPAVTEIVVPNGSMTKSGSKATLTFGTGDTVGAASSTDNAVVRFDGTTGKIIQNSLVTMGDNGAITLPMTSASGVREVLLNLSVSDSGNARWLLANATSTNSSFIPSMVGYFDTNATSASMDFRGLVSAANDASDSATPGIIEFTAARTDSTSDPANGTLSAIVNRKLWTVNNTGTRVILLTAAGHLYLGSGGAFGFASAANATGTIDTRWVRHAAGTLRASDATTGGGTLLVAPSAASLTGSFTVLPDNAATNALVTVARFGVNSTGTAAAGIGPSIDLSAETTTTNDQQLGSIAGLWTTATHASRTGAISFSTVDNAGANTERARVNFWGMQLSAVVFASLGTPSNGTLTYCSDCTVTSVADNTCAGSGTGSLAMRLNGAWRCFNAQN